MDGLKNKVEKCCFCGREITLDIQKNNPSPLGKEGDVCCSKCNFSIVIPHRMRAMSYKK